MIQYLCSQALIRYTSRLFGENFVNATIYVLRTIYASWRLRDKKETTYGD